MVALYWLLKRLFTYWFMREVLPTLPHRRTVNELFNFYCAPSNQADNLPAITQDDNLCTASVAHPSL